MFHFQLVGKAPWRRGFLFLLRFGCADREVVGFPHFFVDNLGGSRGFKGLFHKGITYICRI